MHAADGNKVNSDSHDVYMLSYHCIKSSAASLGKQIVASSWRKYFHTVCWRSVFENHLNGR